MVVQVHLVAWLTVVLVVVARVTVVLMDWTWGYFLNAPQKKAQTNRAKQALIELQGTACTIQQPSPACVCSGGYGVQRAFVRYL